MVIVALLLGTFVGTALADHATVLVGSVYNI